MIRPRWNLDGKRALVTGAASGLGLGICRSLYARGAALVLVDRDAARLAEVSSQFAGAAIHAMDVTDAAAIERLADAVEADGELHLLFNNAGIALPAPFETMPADDFDRVMAVNFHAVVAMTRAFLPMLREAASGGRHARVVNTSSLFGLIAPTESTAYSAAKFAVAGFGQALGHELEGTGVGVTTVHPGGIATRIFDNEETLSRYGNEERERRLDQSRALLVMEPDRAAEIVVRGVERCRARILVGSDARRGDWLRRVAPVRYWAIARALTPALREE